jgi:tetratricopeptide (TPR) repeat protein
MSESRLTQPVNSRPIRNRLMDFFYELETTAIKRLAGVPDATYRTHLRLLRKYNQEIAARPDSVQLYERRGVTYFELGDYGHALYDFNKALTLNPNSIYARLHRGRVFVKTYRYDLAEREFTWVIETAHGAFQSDAYMNRGWCRLLQNDYLAAISDCDKALEANPRSWMAYNHRGYARKMQGDLYGALSDFRQAWKISPGAEPVIGNIVRILQRPDTKGHRQ